MLSLELHVNKHGIHFDKNTNLFVSSHQVKHR